VDPSEPAVPPTAPSSAPPLAPPGAAPVATPGIDGSAVVARPHTPGVVIAAGVILLALAVLALLWTVLFFVYGALITSISSMVQSNPDLFGSPNSISLEALRPVFYALAFVIFCIAVAHLAAGIGVLGRRSWARITGLVLASLGLAGNLIGLILVLVGAGTTRRELLQNGVVVDPVPSLIFGAIIFVSFGAAYFFVLITLARRGRVFV